MQECLQLPQALSSTVHWTLLSLQLHCCSGNDAVMRRGTVFALHALSSTLSLRSNSGTSQGNKFASGCAARAPAWLVRARGGYGARHGLCNARAAQGVPHGRHLWQDVCHPGTPASPVTPQLGLMRNHARTACVTLASRMKSPYLRGEQLASQACTDATCGSSCIDYIITKPFCLTHPASCYVQGLHTEILSLLWRSFLSWATRCWPRQTA